MFTSVKPELIRCLITVSFPAVCYQHKSCRKYELPHEMCEYAVSFFFSSSFTEWLVHILSWVQLLFFLLLIDGGYMWLCAVCPVFFHFWFCAFYLRVQNSFLVKGNQLNPIKFYRKCIESIMGKGQSLNNSKSSKNLNRSKTGYGLLKSKKADFRFYLQFGIRRHHFLSPHI